MTACSLKIHPEPQRTELQVPPLYDIDGECVCTLPALLGANTDPPIPTADVEALEALGLGDVHEIGGGAGAACVVRRVR